MEEIVEESIEDLVEQLDLGNVDADGDSDLEERIRTGSVTETDMINKARTELYKKLGELGVRDIATVYITGLRLEEARLKVKMKAKDEGGGVKDLREKARRAIAPSENGD